MSYDVDLTCPVDGHVLQLDSPHQMKGGTYAIGGTTDMSLNVTYNYASPYRKYDFSINDLHGKTAGETLPKMKAVAEALGDEVDPDYWQPTEGNAKKALLQLIALGSMRLDGVWRIS